MEATDFVADSDEEEERRGVPRNPSLVPAEDEEQSQRPASTRPRGDASAERVNETADETAASRSEADSAQHGDPKEREIDTVAVSTVELDGGEVARAVPVSSMDVEVVPDAAGDEGEHGSDEDDGMREHEDQGGESDEIVVGSDVQVEARTWPGINKQGGAGRVTAIYREVADDGHTEIVLYDVRYILGGVDKRVESEFVQSLWKVLREAKRLSIGREFYHDQFINEPQRKKLRAAAAGHTRGRTHAQYHEHKATRARAQHGSKQKQSVRVDTNVTSSLDDRDEAQSDSDQDSRHADPAPGLQHLDDGAFLLDRSPPSMVHDEPSRIAKSSVTAGTQDEKTRDQAREQKKGRTRAISNDDESSASESGASGAVFTNDDTKVRNRHRKTKKKRKKTHRVSREPLDEALPITGRKRKRRYVGGYHHGGDDPDATFIQPEDNPAALPDDVARETQFVLASTTEGLCKQRDERWKLLETNLAALAQEKDAVESRMRSLSGASIDELQMLHRKLSELGNFITKDIIRGGIDVMNSLFKALSRRHIPANEMTDLEFDRMVNNCDSSSAWVRSAISSVETVFNHQHAGKGVRLEFDNEESSEASEASEAVDSSTNSDVESMDSDIGNFVQNGYETGYFDPDDISQPRRRRFDDGGRFIRKRTSPRQLPLKRTAQTKVRASTTLDDFYDTFPAQSIRAMTAMQNNFRMVGQRMRASEKWNWSRTIRKKRDRARAGKVMGSPFSSSAHITGIGSRGFSTSHRLNKSTINDTSGTVQAAVVKMRNQRYRSDRRVFPSQQEQQQQQQPVRLVSRSSLNSANGFQLHQLAAPFQGKTMRVEGKQIHAPDAVASSAHPSLETVFGVLSEFLMEPQTRSSDQTALLDFGHWITNPMAQEELEDMDFVFSGDEITFRASRLRQQLTDLRHEEFEVLETLPNGAGDRDEGDVERTAVWLPLTALGEAYHRDIAAFCASVVCGFKSVDAKDVLDILDTVLQELVQSLRQLPVCESLFVDCREYFFYFHAEAPNAKTTPMISAVARTYWYVLQVLFALERDTEKRQLPEQLKKNVRDLLGTARDRIARTVMLFLFDWYLYLPSSHMCPRDTLNGGCAGAQIGGIPCEVPALSLWLSVFRCFRGDDEASPSAVSGKKQFWTSFMKLYSENHITRLSGHFIQEESPGSYLDSSQSAAPPTDGPADEEGMRIKLLGLDSTWDLLMTLMRLLGDETTQNSSVDDEGQWEIVRQLLHAENQYFLPFNLPATVSLQDHEHYLGPHTMRTLERVLWVSKTLPPNAAVVQAIVQQVVASAKPRYTQSILQLPQFFRSFSVESSQTGTAPTSAALLQFMSDNDSDYDVLAVLCQIILIQLARHDKPIARRRFRQPIFQVIQAAMKATEAPAASTPAVPANSRSPSSLWDWGKSTTVPAAQTLKSTSDAAPKPANPQTSREKKRICVSILLTFALDSFDLGNRDDSAGVTVNKGRKREVEFFCKEIVKVGGEKLEPECAVMVSQSLYIMGIGLVKASVEYPEIFHQLNSMLTLGLEIAKAESGETPHWCQWIQDENKQHRVLDSYVRGNLTVQEQRFRLIQGSILSALHLLRDLTSQLCSSIAETQVVRSSCEVEAAKMAYSFIINSGLDGCFAAAVDHIISVEDLNIAVEILQIVIPRSQDVATQSTRVLSESDQIQEVVDSGDIFATMDMDSLTGQASPPSVKLSIDDLKPHAVGLVVKSLRVTLQKLVIDYPKPGSFQELFVIDLLGMIISTGEIPFVWSQVTAKSKQTRYLGSRLFSAAVKYSSDNEWFRNSFLSDPNAGQDLANLWMMATVNTSTLDPTPLTFKGNAVTFSIAQEASILEEINAHPSRQIRDSDCWVMLTDGIVRNVLRKDNNITRGKMQPLLFDLLYRVASTCRLPSQLSLDPSAIHNASKLYALHLDVFQAFAKSAGDMWRSFGLNEATQRANMHKLRSITVSIFSTFVSAYQINIKESCMHIADTATNLLDVLDKFTSAFTPGSGKSFHDIDDAISHEALASMKYPAVRTLITMLRFLYQCVDALFFYCGDMAIGRNNLFTTTLEYLFREAVTAEHSQAQKRLVTQDLALSKLTVRSAKKDDLFQGCEAVVVSFVQSVQLFFARQKYPALLHWFALTSRTYLTFTPAGWPHSQLRTLLANALDPEGPLGIHSFYPMEERRAGRRRFDVKDVRREAFYLACGLFVCQCTKSFEHCKVRHGEASMARSITVVRQMRWFLLNEFVRESIEFASEKVGNVDETLLPLLQLLRAVLNHANLNRQRGEVLGGEGDGSWSAITCRFDMREIHSSLEWITLYAARVLSSDAAIQQPLRTVLLIEYCGIVRESTDFIKGIDVDRSTSQLLHLALEVLKSTYDALSKTSIPSLSSAPSSSQTVGARLSSQLALFDSSNSAAAGFETSWILRAEQESMTKSASASSRYPSYGISASRARADLLLALRQVLQLDALPSVSAD